MTTSELTQCIHTLNATLELLIRSGDYNSQIPVKKKLLELIKQL